MQTEPCLIIFVDGFAYDYLVHARYLSALTGRARLISGLGYSVNQKALLLGPYTPDEAGYFCQWTYDPQSPLRKLGWALQVLSVVDIEQRFSAIAHRVLSRATGLDLFRIPFRYLKFFSSMKGVEAYNDDFPLPTVLSRGGDGVHRILYRDLARGEDRDARLFHGAGDTIAGGLRGNKYFIASADLDAVGHRHGPSSPVTAEKVEELDELLGATIDRFLNRYPDGRVCVFSDHGMAKISGYVPFRFEKSLGPANEQTYLYFLDSTMLRVWCFRPGIEEQVAQYLDSLDCGYRLSAADRSSFGVTSPSFGDIIFLLSEGLTPDRSFAGGLRTVGLHGYDPEAASQHGIFLTNAPELIGSAGETESRVTTRFVADSLATLLAS